RAAGIKKIAHGQGRHRRAQAEGLRRRVPEEVEVREGGRSPGRPRPRRAEGRAAPAQAGRLLPQAGSAAEVPRAVRRRRPLLRGPAATHHGHRRCAGDPRDRSAVRRGADAARRNAAPPPAQGRALITPPPEAHSGSPTARAEIQDLPDDAILEAEPEDLAASPDDEEVVATSLAAGSPIADLLSADAEEEIELLSISTDRAEEPEADGSGDDLEAAFGAIVPDARAAPRKVPARVPLFDDLPRDAFVELVNRLSYRRYGAGEQILKEGEPGRSFFVIVEGKVRIWKKLPGDEELQLATVEEGAFFGAMALLSGAPRTADVSAADHPA